MSAQGKPHDGVPTVLAASRADLSFVRIDVQQASTRCSFVRLIWQPSHVTGGAAMGRARQPAVHTPLSPQFARRVSDHLHLYPPAGRRPAQIRRFSTPWLDVAARACDDLAKPRIEGDHRGGCRSQRILSSLGPLWLQARCVVFFPRPFLLSIMRLSLPGDRKTLGLTWLVVVCL